MPIRDRRTGPSNGAPRPIHGTPIVPQLPPTRGPPTSARLIHIWAYEAESNNDVLTGTLSIVGHPTFNLFDFGASCSFIF